VQVTEIQPLQNGAKSASNHIFVVMFQGRHVDDLKIAATRFREALESIPSDERTITLQRFPIGACGDATLLLGTYLIETEEEPFDYMLGETNEDHEDSRWSSHAWLQRGDLVVDISADQFPEIDERIVVTLDSPWHKSLNGEAQHVADFKIYADNTMNPLSGMYRIIRARMDET
jgi:hypothetical protein